MKYAFAGDRQISCNILKYLIGQGYRPTCLLVTDGASSSHAQELIEISGLESKYIFIGKEPIKDTKVLTALKEMKLDYIIGIHFPYIIPSELLNVPNIGFLNLHPAYLPYNKGWHTPSWAIIDGSKYGATLHFMSEQLDEGYIIHQKKIKAKSYDTANSLYQKALRLEEEVFKEALDSLVSLNPQRIIQTVKGTSHKKSDLGKISAFDLNDTVVVSEFLDKLRALTTNRENELAYYLEGNKKIGVKVEFIEIE